MAYLIANGRGHFIADTTMKRSGFTFIELLVVLAIMATLMSIVAPRYFSAVDKAKEAVLKTDLRVLRESLDKYQADHGRLPNTLQQLVDEKYLPSVPIDPMTDKPDTWRLITVIQGREDVGIRDVRSGAEGNGRNGKPYKDW